MASLGTNLAAAIAFNRFGLGGRPDDAIPADPKAWLTGQLAGPDPYSGFGLPNTATCMAMIAGYQQSIGNPTAQAAWNAQIQQVFNQEMTAFITHANTTTAPFRERLVWFWTNHFTVSALSHDVQANVGAYVREAIRPNVNGTFKDMLLAVFQHPAMIYSLNNQLSSGPQSPLVQRSIANGAACRGINENLARECLELHTVGINAGYTQADVDSLAMLLTGWSVNLTTAPYGFTFVPNMHQPGNQTLLGATFGADRNAGIAALSYLATHPATYQHLATKLVTHFVSDTPSLSDIATVAQVLACTGGNLAAAATAVVNLPSAWQPYAKMRNPLDYVVAVNRALGNTGPGVTIATNPIAVASALGCPLWQPPFPNGYSDIAADWAGPAQMLLRADWINTFATLLTTTDPTATAASSLGPLLKPATIAAIGSAASLHDKLSLLFLSAEFQRR